MNLDAKKSFWIEDQIEEAKKESFKEADRAWQKLEQEGISSPDQFADLADQHPERFGDEEELLKKVIL